MAENPRATARDLTRHIQTLLGHRLLGVYLFGSLATGDFVPGRSDIDLVAVLAADISTDELAALQALHERFESEHAEWRNRIEVLYISRTVLATFAAAPTGIVVRISPGEALHYRDLEGNLGWLLDWHFVVAGGETLAGPPPASLGPAVSPDRFREAVLSQLHEMAETARRNEVAYVPAQQGYIVATVSRGLYSLATGQSTSKTKAIEWLAAQRPELAEWLRATYAAYRADVRGPHGRLIAFVDEALHSSSA